MTVSRSRRAAFRGVLVAEVEPALATRKACPPCLFQDPAHKPLPLGRAGVLLCVTHSDVDGHHHRLDAPEAVRAVFSHVPLPVSRATSKRNSPAVHLIEILLCFKHSKVNGHRHCHWFQHQRLCEWASSLCLPHLTNREQKKLSSLSSMLGFQDEPPRPPLS